MTNAKQSSKPKPRSADPTVGEIVKHPLRARFLTYLTERDASPNELKDIFNVSLSDAAYHVRVLADFGAIELVRTEPVRGAMEHFYKGVLPPFVTDEEFAEFTVTQRLEFASYICQVSFADVTGALREGTFSKRPDHYVTRTPLWVDEEGWEELNEIFADAVARIAEVQVASSKRMQLDPECEVIPVTALSFFFERPTPLGRTHPSE